MYFQNYGFLKTLLDKCLKSRVSEDPSTSNMGKWDQTVLNSEWHPFYHVYWSLQGQLNSKKSLLVIDKILRIFFNTFTAGNKYSFLKRDILGLPIQMHLSLKGKTFSQFFSPFLKFRLNSEHFQKTWPS